MPHRDAVMAFLALIARYWQIAAGAALGAIVALAVAILYINVVSLPAAREQGRNAYIAQQAAASAAAELKRKGDDAKLNGMSDYDLCVAGLKSGGMRDTSPCAELRGLHGQQTDATRDGGADPD